MSAMAQTHTHYDNLKVTHNAPPEVIRAAYKALSQRYHPDRNTSPDATKIMKMLNDAYAVLSDAESRRGYDVTIAQQLPESAAWGEVGSRSSIGESNATIKRGKLRGWAWLLAVGVVVSIQWLVSEPATHKPSVAAASSGEQVARVAAKADEPVATVGYAERVGRRVRTNIAWTNGVAGLETVIGARCAPNGALLSASIVHSSGNAQWDETALRAVQRLDPMPDDTNGETPAAFAVTVRSSGN
ncbi:TonB family protein [Caballeronia sp. GAFFF2]|uniref:TonB family protein n=1 Tax=Caballeronia sp. GAFFF2 TaxID=2921741 RepID=UPI002027F220|nr:TonB family protein [Caballeronia sp. GAFFF2]